MIVREWQLAGFLLTILVGSASSNGFDRSGVEAQSSQETSFYRDNVESGAVRGQRPLRPVTAYTYDDSSYFGAANPWFVAQHLSESKTPTHGSHHGKKTYTLGNFPKSR